MKRVVWGLLILLVLAAAGFFALVPGLIDRQLNRVAAHEPYAISPAAQALHGTLGLADLHADTLLWSRDVLDRASHGHVDVPRLQQGRVTLQVFSVVTKTPAGLNYDNNAADSDDLTLLVVSQLWPIRTWNSLFERALYQSEKLHRAAAESPDRLRIVRTRADLADVIARNDPGLVAGLLAIEGAHALEGKAENLRKLYDAGFRMIGLAHFFDNELGGSLHGVAKGGLTPFGREMVREMERLGIIVDLAHASTALVEDVLAMAARPVVVSHTGVRGACDSPRNLSDAHMRRIAEQGGLIGVGYWPGAVCDPTPEGIVRSLRYAIGLVGIEHVALGSDYDGAVLVHFDTSEVAVLVDRMLAAGFTEAEIRAVTGDNVRRFLLENLPPG